MSEDSARPCQGCGASIYTEHLDTGIAGYFGGKLLCPHCLEEAESNADATSGGKAAEDLEVIALADEEPVDRKGKSETHIRAIGGESQAGTVFDDSGLKRPPDPKVPTATRCRTFHAKLNEGAVLFMNRQINEWTDSSPEVTIKFATSTIGIFEGKKADPHLILTVFY
jgi:hypothetical protein